MRNIAVILAGGSGHRLGSERPKQFLTVAGKPIIAHTISAFEAVEEIDEICVVTRADYIEDTQQIVAQYAFQKVKHIVAGGRERYDSSLAALNLYSDSDCALLFHDAVRPMVSRRIIRDCVQALREHEAVGVAIDVTDTIWEAAEDNTIATIPNRSQLRAAQTPQGFHRDIIRKAYDRALADPNFKVTDDAGVIRTYLPEVKIHIVAGETTNIKLTYSNDIPLLERLIQEVL